MSALRIMSLAAGLLLAGAGSATASGLHVARFGGEMGHPTATNPTSVYFNPAGMAFESGHRGMVDLTYGINWVTYERFEEAISSQPPSDTSIAANTGEATLTNTAIVPYLAFVTDFGTGAPFGVGAAFFAPIGGGSVYDKVPAMEGVPGAVDGPARWWNIEGTMQTLQLSFGGAYRFEAIRLSIGITGNVFFSTIDALQAQNIDGSDDLVTASGDLKEGRVRIDATSVDWGMAFGLLWEAVEEVFWVGASYQSRPNFGAAMELTGTIDNVFAIGQPSRNNLIIRQQMPDTLRLGLRYRPSGVVELRLFGDWTRWSAFENQCFVNADVESDAEAACRFNADGSQASEATVLWNVVRDWHDTFGIRFGVSWWVIPPIELFVGVGYDRNAIPGSNLEPGLLDFDIIQAALGGRFQLTPWLALLFTATNWFALDQDTRGEQTFARYAAPSVQPNSAGTYQQNILTLNFGAELTFGGGAESGD